MSHIREFGTATIITHGKNPEVFTVRGGMYIPIGVKMDVMAPQFREGLNQYLDKWFKPDGSLMGDAINRSHREKPEGQNLLGDNEDQRDK